MATSTRSARRTATKRASKPARHALTRAAALTQRELLQRTIARRSIEAVTWGMPAVNFELMFDAALKAKGDWNQIVYWSGLPDWKNQTLTPNPDTIYLMPFYDTRRGPVVLEIPPAEGGSITGSVDDGWQTAIEDVGPAGVDKGQGGKYLIVPPGFSGEVPAGYIAMRSSTFTGYALLRANVRSSSDEDVANAVTYSKQIRFHPFTSAAKPPATRFVDALGVLYDSTIPYDLRFFEVLNRFVQREPWLERDRAMIDVLRTLGIEKGEPFKPDAATKRALEAGAREARAVLDASYETGFVPFVAGRRWALPASKRLVDGITTNYADPDNYPVDDRGLAYSFAFFSAKHLGEGQFYLMATKDKAGRSLDGGKSYRLRVPAKAPVKLYWSATAYDRATHALIRGTKWSSRASTTAGLQTNSDGSIDVFFGPRAPAGKQSNWLPTRAGGEFEVLFRLYGPDKPFFDKTWILPDIERAK